MQVLTKIKLITSSVNSAYYVSWNLHFCGLHESARHKENFINVFRFLALVSLDKTSNGSRSARVS